jgi:hypothetical protein
MVLVRSDTVGLFLFVPIGAILLSNRTQQTESPADVPVRTSAIPVFEMSSLGRVWLTGFIVTKTEFVPLRKAA